MPKLEITDLTRLKLEPGEVLLVRLPREMSPDTFQRGIDIIRAKLREIGFNWTVIFARDDVEFVAIDGSAMVPADRAREIVREEFDKLARSVAQRA